MVVPSPLEIPAAIRFHPEDLRVLLRHPAGLCAAGRGKHRVDAVFVQMLNDLIQPLEGVYPLRRLQRRPGEDAHGHAVDACLLHQPDILLQHLRCIQPLLRVIVRPVEQAV